MADYFFPHYEIIKYDVTILLFSILYADIWGFRLGNLNFKASYLENGLVDFDDTYTILQHF